MVVAAPAAGQRNTPDDEGQLDLRPGAPLADASGLGPLRRMSDPGRALLAEIPILDILPVDSDRQAVDVSVKLVDLVEAGPSSPSEPPEIRAMVRSRADGSRYVLIGSRRAMSQPTLTILVELRWPGGSYRRTYRVDTTTELAAARELMPARPLAADASRAAMPAVPVPLPAPLAVPAPAPVAPAADTPLPPISIAAAPVAAVPPAPAVPEQPAPSLSVAPVAPAPAPLAEPVRVAEPVATPPAAPARSVRQRTRPVPVAAAVPAVARAGRPAGDALPQVAADDSDRRYRVLPGDTLAAIGQRYEAEGVSARQAMAAIYQGNAGAFRGDPNRLLAGAQLTIPVVSAMREAPPLVVARAPVPVRQPAGDRLSLAAPEPASSDRRPQVGEESAIALSNALQEADSRISDLQSQVNQLNQLITAQSKRIEQLSAPAQANARLIRVDQREQRRSLPLRRDAEPEFHVDTTVVVGVLLAAAVLMYLVVRLLTRWRTRPLRATP